jgi:hypothetical protein
MTTTAMTDLIQSATRSRLAGLPFRLLAGIPLVLGAMLSFLGLAYDVQWHSTVGPDTIFCVAPFSALQRRGVGGIDLSLGCAV